MVYVGVDLHRKRAHVVALDPAGEVVLSRRIGNAPAEFWRSFGELELQLPAGARGRLDAGLRLIDAITVESPMPTPSCAPSSPATHASDACCPSPASGR
jgi:hypothetical protein